MKKAAIALAIFMVLLLVTCTLPLWAQQLAIPAQSCTATVVCQGSTVTLPTTVPVTPPPPPITGVPHLDYVMYQNGRPPTFLDDSWSMQSVNYGNKTNVYPGNSASLLCTLAGPNGGWQPLFVPNGATSFFDTSGYKYLLISIRPPVDNSSYWIGFAGNKDTADGIQIEVAGPGFTKYGLATKGGVWADYKILLADFKMTDAKNVFKFGVADGTGLPAGTQLLYDNVGLAH